METTGALAALAPLHSAAVDGAFGLQDVGSAASLDGATRALPFSPLPLPHVLPSGLSRPQQLHMLQRFFNVPASPSYHGPAGGLVLDRVLASAGNAACWVTATARLRAQAAWESPHTREGKPHRALLEPGLYGAGLRARAALPGGFLLRGSAQLDSLHAWLPSPGASTGGEVATQSGVRGPVRARATLLHQALVPGHDVTLDAGWHTSACTNPGAALQPDGGGAYVEVPRLASATVASRKGRRGLRYRLGLVTDHTHRQQGAAPPGVWDGFGRLYAQAGVTLGGAVSFYPRAPEATGTGVRRWPKAARPEYSAMPQRARLTLGMVVGGVGRAPMARPAAIPPAASPPSGAPTTLVTALKQAVRATSSEGVAFASLCCGLQAGSFARPVLDYTALSVRADAIAGSGALASALTPAPRGASGRGSASGSTPVTCLLSASVAQQLVGPVRLWADVRMPAHTAAQAARALVAPRGEGGSRGGIASLPGVEAIYGLDVSLPAVLGAARVVGWYNPAAREALAELRFLES